MILQSLKITECPLAFTGFAEKHNALVDFLAQTVGQNGITVVIAERNMKITGGGAGGGDLTALTARVATLETLTSGMSRQSVLYCSGGANTTITILRT